MISILERIASALEKNIPSQYASELDIAIQEQKQRIDKAKSDIAIIKQYNEMSPGSEKDALYLKMFKEDISCYSVNELISWLPKAEIHYHELLIARSKV